MNVRRPFFACFVFFAACEVSSTQSNPDEAGGAEVESKPKPVPAEPEPEPEPEPGAEAGVEPGSAEAGGGGEEAGRQPEGTIEVVKGKDRCRSDKDCVPATCCHATACVASSKAPKCDDVACTMDCQGGTMDCGGGCACMDGVCAAKLFSFADPSAAPR